MEHDDRRREVREPITLVVEYDGADELVTDFTDNLSAGGTFVRTDRLLALGTPVRLILSFPGLLRPILVSGAVRWIKPLAAGEDSGIGIEFGELAGDVRAELDELLAALSRRSPALMRRVIRVLVVEDNPHVARLITEGLSGANRFGDDVSFDFVVSSDGRAALSDLDGREFDAAIVDMNLPVLDGEQLIIAIRRDERMRRLPVIAVSAGGPSARAAALGAGADLFLDKPMRLRQIVESMASLVGLAQRAARPG